LTSKTTLKSDTEHNLLTLCPKLFNYDSLKFVIYDILNEATDDMEEVQV